MEVGEGVNLLPEELAEATIIVMEVGEGVELLEVLAKATITYFELYIEHFGHNKIYLTEEKHKQINKQTNKQNITFYFLECYLPIVKGTASGGMVGKGGHDSAQS